MFLELPHAYLFLIAMCIPPLLNVLLCTPYSDATILLLNAGCAIAFAVTATVNDIIGYPIVVALLGLINYVIIKDNGSFFGMLMRLSVHNLLWIFIIWYSGVVLERPMPFQMDQPKHK